MCDLEDEAKENRVKVIAFRKSFLVHESNLWAIEVSRLMQLSISANNAAGEADWIIQQIRKVKVEEW